MAYQKIMIENNVISNSLIEDYVVIMHPKLSVHSCMFEPILYYLHLNQYQSTSHDQILMHHLCILGNPTVYQPSIIEIRIESN